MADVEVDPVVRELSAALLPRSEGLAVGMADRLRAEIPLYAEGQFLSRHERGWPSPAQRPKLPNGCTSTATRCSTGSAGLRSSADEISPNPLKRLSSMSRWSAHGSSDWAAFQRSCRDAIRALAQQRGCY